MTGPRQFQPYAILPVLATVTAFALALLCVFAGNQPGMMDDYAVLTLNVSRIGRNAVDKVDGVIMGFNVSKIVQKRSLPVEIEPYAAAPPLVRAPEIIVAPDPDVILAARDTGSLVGGLSAGVAGLQSEVGGKVTSVQAAIESKPAAIVSGVESGINSIEALAASKISSALGALQTSVVQDIDETYIDMIEEMDLSGFYAIHLLTTCSGEYVTPNGTNITVGIGSLPPNGTTKHIDACEQHSELNPLIFLRVLYYISTVCLGLALPVGVWSVLFFSREKAIASIIFLIPALGFLAITSVSAHAISKSAAVILNFIGDEIGIKADQGDKFIALTWATTILVLVTVGLWTLLGFFGQLLSLPGKRNQGVTEIHEMSNLGKRAPVVGEDK